MDLKQNNKEPVSEARASYRSRMHMAMLQIALIFGIPAIVAVIAGRYLDGRFQTGKAILFLLLGLAFASSWVAVVMMYRRLSLEIKKLDASEHKGS